MHKYTKKFAYSKKKLLLCSRFWIYENNNYKILTN